MVTRLYLCLLTMMLGIGVAVAGPFGFNFGDMPTDYPSCNLAEDNKFIWYCSNAPTPAKGFEWYAVWATDETGICLISSIQPMDAENIQLSDVHENIDTIATLVSEKYGEPDITPDDLKHDPWFPTYKSRKIEWMRKQTSYAFEWAFEEQFENTINQIFLFATKDGQGNHAIRIDYSGARVCRRRLLDKSVDLSKGVFWPMITTTGVNNGAKHESGQRCS